jgi:Tol biopolymer transport system component
VQSLAFSPDGKTLASAGYDARTKLWDVATATRLHQIRGADRSFKSVAFSPDGKNLLVKDSTGELALWQVDSGQRLRHLGPADDEKRSIGFAAFLPDGKSVLTSEVGAGRPGALNARPTDPPEPPSSRRGYTVAEIRTWATESGRLLRFVPIRAARGYYEVDALSPDGKVFAIGGSDHISIWDTATGEQLGQLSGFAGGAATALAFSPDGKTLASGSPDTSVLLWDLARAHLVYTWTQLISDSGDDLRPIKRLAPTPEQAVPLLGKWLDRVVKAEVRANELVRDLDSDRFAVRENSSRELVKMGPEGTFAIRLALEGSPSMEVRARLETALKKTKGRGAEHVGFQPRSVWLALSLLEELGTPEAHQVLETLAKQPSNSRVVRKAQAALQRLAERPKRP